MSYRYLVVTAMLLATPELTAAQVVPPSIEIPVDGVTQELQLKDGTRLIGRVESIIDGQFTFRTTSGLELKLEMASVQSIRPFTGRLVNGELWESDPNTTRLFFAPTGRSLKRGEAYFGVYEVFMPFVQVGVTDRLSIGGGTPLIFFGDDGDVERLYWLTPKLQILEAGRTSASIGVIHFFNFNDDGGAGIAYGVVTHGSDDAAFTIGAGYAYHDHQTRDPYVAYPYHQEEDRRGSPVVMIGGERRASKRVKIVSENYVFDGGGIASAGVRFFGEKLSADFGLVVS